MNFKDINGIVNKWILMLYVLLLNIDISEGRLEYFFLMKEYRCFFLMFVFNGGICNIDIYLLVILLIFLEFIIWFIFFLLRFFIVKVVNVF